LRKRLALVAAAVVVVAAVAAVLVTRGGGAPPDTAAKLVPAAALAYAHLSTDPEREADRRLLARLASFPSVRALRDRLTTSVGADFDLARDVRPWLGKEVAFALLDTGGRRADSLLLLALGDRAKAEAFIGRAAGSRGTTTYRGVEVRRFAAVSVAFVPGYLAVGQDSAVRAAIDRSQGRGASLAASVVYKRVAADRPDDRALDVVLPAEGVQRVLVPAPGMLGVLGSVLAHERLLSVSASLADEEDGLRLTVRQAKRGGESRDFEPKLLADVPKAASGYLGMAGVDALGAVVPAASRTQLARLLRDALDAASLDLERDLLAPLRGEVAVSVTPGLPVPTVTLVARTADESRTREAMARLQQPVSELLAGPGGSGTPQPAFEQRELGEVPTFSLTVAPGLELAYAVTAGRLIVSTQVNGVGHVLAERASLRDSPGFERAVHELPERAEAVLFLDLGQLLALAEQAGSASDPAFQAVQGDLRKVRVAGAVVQREKTDSTAELFFEIP
jgi:hypothetical protein